MVIIIFYIFFTFVCVYIYIKIIFFTINPLKQLKYILSCNPKPALKKKEKEKMAGRMRKWHPCKIVNK